MTGTMAEPAEARIAHFEGAPDDARHRSVLVVPQSLFLSGDAALGGDGTRIRSLDPRPARLSAGGALGRILRPGQSAVDSLFDARHLSPVADAGDALSLAAARSRGGRPGDARRHAQPALHPSADAIGLRGGGSRPRPRLPRGGEPGSQEHTSE